MDKRSRSKRATKRAHDARLPRDAKHVAAADFKARCLELMDQVQRSHQSLVITKHGRPVARLIPYDSEPPDIVGVLAGALTSYDNIVSPVDDPWDADA